MAHSRPTFLPGFWDRRDDASFFVAWMDELVQQTKNDEARLQLHDQRDSVLALYEEARRFYLKMTTQAA